MHLPNLNAMRFPVLFLLGAWLLAGCGAKQQPLLLADTHWQLTAYETQGRRHSAHSDRAAHLDFTADKFSGNTGCNNFGGQYRLTGDQLKGEGVYATKMACLAGNASEQERVFLAVLGATSTAVRTAEGGLALTAGEMRLFFVPAAAQGDGSAKAEPEPEPMPEPSTTDMAAAPAERTASPTPVWRLPEPEPALRGMFAYLADAAVFISCTDKKRYPVAMEAGFVELERSYLALMGDEAGRQALLVAKGAIRSRDKMDGRGKTPTVVVDGIYSLHREANCTTPIERLAGDYVLDGGQPRFKDCANGKGYAAHSEAALRAYRALKLPSGAAVYGEVEGFTDADGLHITRLLGFRAGETCAPQ
jgi:heat shock protein HslJ